MSEPIVIFSTAYFPLVGGAEVAMKEITDRLPNEVFHLVTARIRSGLVSTERIGNVQVHRLGIGHPIDKYLLPFLSPWKAWRIQRGVKDPIAWALMASFGGFGALFYTWLRPKTRFLLTLQEGDPLEYIDKRVGIFQSIFKRIFIRADAVQAISHFLADWAVRMGARVVPEVVPNGVTIDRFTVSFEEGERERLRESLGYTKDDVILITTSRLTLKNGIDDVVRALPLLPERVKFLVIGEGEDQEKLVKLIKENALEKRVQLLGKRDHAELPKLLAASDLFIRASLSEGLGISFLEAMAVGLPVIATPVGGIPDFLKDGETGVFCQPRDPASIVVAIQRLLDDAELVRKLHERGPALIRQDYDWDKLAQRIGLILRSLRV